MTQIISYGEAMMVLLWMWVKVDYPHDIYQQITERTENDYNPI